MLGQVLHVALELSHPHCKVKVLARMPPPLELRDLDNLGDAPSREEYLLGLNEVTMTFLRKAFHFKNT